MTFLKLVCILSSFLIMSGCASSKAVHKAQVRPRSMIDVYAYGAGQSQKDVAQFIENNLKEQKTFGYVKPYIPVVNQPVVRKVWVPDHKSQDNPDVLIAGHWVYMMIQPSKWFIDEKTEDYQFPVIVPAAPQRIDKKE